MSLLVIPKFSLTLECEHMIDGSETSNFLLPISTKHPHPHTSAKLTQLSDYPSKIPPFFLRAHPEVQGTDSWGGGDVGSSDSTIGIAQGVVLLNGLQGCAIRLDRGGLGGDPRTTGRPLQEGI